MNWLIRELPEEDRPREKLQKRGAAALTDAELLAIFLRVGRKGASAVQLAGDLLEKFQSLNGIAAADVKQLTQVPGIGPAKAAEIAATGEMASRLAAERFREVRVDSPEVVHGLLGTEMAQLKRESLRALLLNTRHGLIRVEEISLGSLNESCAHPREILRPAIVHSAHAFILVHNHPSGDPTPSAQDRQLTRRLAEAAQAVQIAFLDHVIIGRPGDETPSYFSFCEAGIFPMEQPASRG